MKQKMKCHFIMFYYFVLLWYSIFPASITAVDSKIVNHLPDDKRSPYFPHQWVKTTINRAKISGNPECRFSFEITIPESNDPKALHHDTVCLYWSPGGFGALELENRVYIYENGFSQIHTSMIPLRSLGILTVNGNLLLSNNSYVFGYILGSDFFGMVQMKKVYFIETRNKISKILNMSERSMSPSTGHSAIIFPEEVAPIYDSHRDNHRNKRNTNDYDYDDDDDDNDADNSSDTSKENLKIETSLKSINSLPIKNVFQNKITSSVAETQLSSAKDRKQEILRDLPDFFRPNKNILLQTPHPHVSTALQPFNVALNDMSIFSSDINPKTIFSVTESHLSPTSDQEQDVWKDFSDSDDFRSNENIFNETPDPIILPIRLTQSLNIALNDMPISPSDAEPKTTFSVTDRQLSPTNYQEQDSGEGSSDLEDFSSSENVFNETPDSILSTVTQSLSFKSNKMSTLPNEAELINMAFKQKQEDVFQFENKRLLVCKVALIAHESFFWSLGRGNEASTVGRVMYYLDFADSFLRAQNWSGNMQRESIGLELETIHLDISTTNITALYANMDQMKFVQSGNKMIPPFEKENDSCLTILFTATRITNSDTHWMDTQWQPVGMCPNHKTTSTLAIQETFPIIINAIGKDGKEIPDARIIHDVIEKILYSFGGNPASPPCENKQTSSPKFFEGFYLKSLTLKNCIRDQISSTLNRKIGLSCLHQKNSIGACKPIAWNAKENCDCGYRGYCLSDTNLCCLKFHGNIFRKCSVDNVSSKCYNKPLGSCHLYDSVCLSASNYVKGSFGELYAMENYNEEGRDSSSSMTFHLRYLSPSILVIFWHSLFYFLLDE